MLNMLPTSDSKLLDDLSHKIFSRPFHNDIGYVFYENEQPIGFASLQIGDTSCISSIGVLPTHRGKGRGNFFTCSILFRLSQISRYVKISYVSDYYLKFGFEKRDGYMIIASEKLLLGKHEHC